MARVSHPTWRAYSNAWMGIVFGIPFLCVGLLTLAIGLDRWKMAHDAINWSTAQAKVLAQKEIFSRRGGAFTEITCKFQTSDGRAFTAIGSLDRQNEKLSTVTIYYDPTRPQRNLLSPEGAKFMGRVFTIVGAPTTAMGAYLIIFGISTIVKHRRENRLFEQKRAAELERRANRSV